ncbi:MULTISPECIES: PilN domain-containing protein [Idiomarina]|uniref:PilN domain-containing protein n=1 Tax=Idiomarinaceae TaxID=267893 RepID=UPI00129A2598|nr:MULTISPECIES: PilN domain-containing protein [Idiomarina]MRJ41692.1 pilus assembly protein PilN [Idiomarina sp. FeN1]NCU57682.1 pilus assembly protein PilN [Idiomarina sp. FenA--70]NCU60234.1 pilus assembly protein PilN [Idiomarina sp. FenBw--71]UUN13421.1 PilN domain-containing protein [Idiomarina loihiensis]
MAHINLLPWRETVKQRAKTRFGIHAALALGSAALIFAVAYFLINDYKNYQQRRNQFLQSEILVLDSQIAEIRNINKKKDEVLNRMKLIQALHEDRNTAITLFNELTQRTPDGVYLHSVEKRELTLTINGRSSSNNRVAEFLRALKDSPTFAQPELRNVVAASANDRSIPDADGLGYDAFSLTINIVPTALATGDTGGKP